MVDKAFELAMIQSTKIIEKTMARTNDNDVDHNHNHNINKTKSNEAEASYLLDNDSCDEELLLLSCTKAEQNYNKRLKVLSLIHI